MSTEELDRMQKEAMEWWANYRLSLQFKVADIINANLSPLSQTSPQPQHPQQSPPVVHVVADESDVTPLSARDLYLPTSSIHFTSTASNTQQPQHQDSQLIDVDLREKWVAAMKKARNITAIYNRPTLTVAWGVRPLAEAWDVTHIHDTNMVFLDANIR